MKIGIILNPYGEAKPGGLARTILEWTRGLLNYDNNDDNDKKNEYIIFLKDEPIYKPILPGRNWKFYVLGGGKFWLNKLKKMPQADIYLFQTPVLPLGFTPKNSIIIAQDFPYFYLRPHNLKEAIRNFVVKRYHENSLRRARHIIAVSEATKKDLMRFFAVPEHKISVIHMGFKNVCAGEEIFVPLPEKFFLFVGVIKERKNVLRVVEAFRDFTQPTSFRVGSNEPKNNSDYKLVFAGRPSGWYAAQVKKLIADNNLNDQIVFLDHINDGQLSYVYKRAEALLFPSIVESFGFPVLEAMACGTPVITANFGGPAEIGADEALLINPYHIAEITQAMIKISSDAQYRAQLITAGQVRVKEFSWAKTAAKTLELIKVFKS